MVVNPFNNPGNIAAATGGSTAGAAVANGEAFESQLSAALAESLGKLGVTPGEVNITIRNDGSTAGTGLRQIVVSYKVTPDPATGTTTPAESSSSSRNPFLPSSSNAASVPTAAAPAAVHSWAPYVGPRDSRDETPAGGGVQTASGAPSITLNQQPAANQYGYTGAAARNPYFTSPSNPLRPGLVLGFQNWFQENFVYGTSMGPMPANKIFNSTEEGAQEALRLVQAYAPEAKVVNKVWGSEGGPYTASKPTYYVEIGDGKLLNAGALLNSYYNQGYGVSVSSDEALRRSIELS